MANGCSKRGENKIGQLDREGKDFYVKICFWVMNDLGEDFNMPKITELK